MPRFFVCVVTSTLEREKWRGELPGTGLLPASDEMRRDGAKRGTCEHDFR